SKTPPKETWQDIEVELDALFNKIKPDIVKFSKTNYQPFSTCAHGSVQVCFMNKHPTLLLSELPSIGECGWTKYSDINLNIGFGYILGTSGCGKTRTVFEILCKHFGLYMVAEHQGNLGNDIAKRYYEQGLLSRYIILLRLLKCGCTEPCQWLYLQLFPYIDGIGDIFVQTMEILQAANSLDLSNYLEQCEQTLIEMTNQRKLPIFYDEAQIDGNEMVDMFLSSFQPLPNDENKIDKKADQSQIYSELRPLLSISVETFLRSKVCLYLCGSGLSITNAMKILQSKISKFSLEPERYVNFGGFDDYESFQTFIRRFIGVGEIDDHSLEDAFIWLRGRFRFTTSYLELIFGGLEHTLALQTIKHVVANIENEGPTLPATLFTSDYSLIKPLKDLMTKNHPRPDYVDGVSVLQLVEKAVLTKYLTGLPALFSNDKEMYLMEIGFARLKKHTVYTLKAIVDEPLAVVAGLKFFNESNDVGKFVIKQMTLQHYNPSTCGFLWEQYIPQKLKDSIFNEKTRLCEHPLFKDIKELPSFYSLTARIFGFTNDASSSVLCQKSNSQVKLYDFLLSVAKRECNVPFFIPDDYAGPDIVFFVEFSDGSMIMVLIQVKLRSKLHNKAQAFATVEPSLLYTAKDNNIPSVEHEKVVKLIKENGWDKTVLKIVIAYPAKFKYVNKAIGHSYNTRSNSMTSTIQIVINQDNAHHLFDAKHLHLLDHIKNHIEDFEG
ncbi:6419_t:CDS:2, partial [Entrophospora sp. SA101]